MSQMHTITVEGLVMGGKIPVGSTLVASRRASDRQGQFVSAAEAEGWRSDNAMCFAADTMDNLQQHYDRGKSSESRAKYGVAMGKFANWVTTGEFFFRAEQWKTQAGIASLDKRGRQSGSANLSTPVTNAHLFCLLLPH